MGAGNAGDRGSDMGRSAGVGDRESYTCLVTGAGYRVSDAGSVTI
jgi:hypothetical protein